MANKALLAGINKYKIPVADLNCCNFFREGEKLWV